ncbi:hypothetical protein D3C72_1319950 [compost metagenome]
MTLEVFIHAFAETLTAHNCLHHADDFRSLFIDRHCKEIVDGHTRLGTNGVSIGSRIFSKLPRTQAVHVINTLNATVRHIRREFLITENGQTFFQRKLEPAVHGDTIACPVMEVFVSDNRFNRKEVMISCRFRIRQHQARVKDVQTFVLHGAGVEIINRDDHVIIQIIFKAVSVLVPLH